MSGSLDRPAGSNTRSASRILNLAGLSLADVKSALDPLLRKGWRLITIYREGTQARAVLVKTEDA